MSDQSTTIEWPYQPPDLFRAVYRQQDGAIALTFNEGVASAIFPGADSDLSTDQIQTTERAVFDIGRAQAAVSRRQFFLSPPTMTRRDGTRTHVAVSLVGLVTTISVGFFDLQVTDSTGLIVTDSRRHREQLAEARRDRYLRHCNDSTVRQALAFLCESEDRSHAFVRLYAVRDAVEARLNQPGNRSVKETALRELRRSPAWGKLGDIANNTNIEESRHPGTYLTRVPATDDLVDAAHMAALDLLDAFVRLLENGVLV